MDGIAKIVNNTCLAALRPVLHALWRDKCVEIGIFLMNIGLHHPCSVDLKPGLVGPEL